MKGQFEGEGAQKILPHVMLVIDVQGDTTPSTEKRLCDLSRMFSGVGESYQCPALFEGGAPAKVLYKGY